MNHRGLLFTLDGQHGAGKTFTANYLWEELSKLGFSVVCFSQPSNTQFGKMARQSEGELNAEASVCLFAADRYQQCKEIETELNKGNIVICDRYFISALILQNIDGVDFEFIHTVNSKIIEPNLSIVIHADKEVILERLKSKDITRFTKIEMNESFDRYLKFKNEIESRVKNVIYFNNNDKSDAKAIADYVINFVKSRSKKGEDN